MVDKELIREVSTPRTTLLYIAGRSPFILQVKGRRAYKGVPFGLRLTTLVINSMMRLDLIMPSRTPLSITLKSGLLDKSIPTPNGKSGQTVTAHPEPVVCSVPILQKAMRTVALKVDLATQEAITLPPPQTRTLLAPPIHRYH